MLTPKSRLKHIKASALGYAIAFMLLVGLVTSGVLFISSTNKRIELNFALEEHMLLNNYLGLRFGSKNATEGTQRIIHASGDTTKITRRNWGAFRVVVAETFHNSRRVVKSALIGDETDVTHPAIYVPDQRQTLKLCGSTRIEGNVYVSERGLERGYLAGQSYKNDKLIYDGEKRKSERSLPGLLRTLSEERLVKYLQNAVKIEPFSKDSTFSFANQTRIVSSKEPIRINQRISGNVILHSFSSLVISGSARLENVLIIAPEVHFEEGFEGSAQVIASRNVLCEKNVRLNYPSAIILHETEKNQGAVQNRIELQENSRVLGGVLLFSSAPNFRSPVYLDIAENATVGGLVYNQGETQVRGKVIGNVYTSKFDLSAGGGQYSNFLLNAEISSKKLPKSFIRPRWLTKEEVTKSRIIACF